MSEVVGGKKWRVDWFSIDLVVAAVAAPEIAAARPGPQLLVAVATCAHHCLRAWVRRVIGGLW